MSEQRHWLSSDPAMRPGTKRAPDAKLEAELARLDSVVARLSKQRQNPVQPFGMPVTPFNPATGKFLAFGDDSTVAVVTVVEIAHDVLLCDRNGTRILIAKPHLLRKSVLHGETIDGKTFTSTAVDAVTVSDGVETDENWLVTPSYYVGEKLIVFRHSENDRARVTVADGEITGTDAGDLLLEWEDVGAGRWWAVEPAA